MSTDLVITITGNITTNNPILEKIARSLCASFQENQEQNSTNSDFNKKWEEYLYAAEGIVSALNLKVIRHERKHPSVGWVAVYFEDVEHYKSMGQEIRSLYAVM